MILLATIGLVAVATAAVFLAWALRPAPAPEPASEVWVRRTTVTEEFRATGPGRDIAPVVFDPRYQTLQPRHPMIEGPR